MVVERKALPAAVRPGKLAVDENGAAGLFLRVSRIGRDDAIRNRLHRPAFGAREEQPGPRHSGIGGLPAFGVQGRWSTIVVA